MSDLVGLSRHQGKATAARNRKEGPAAAGAATAWPRAQPQRPAGQGGWAAS